MENRRLFGCYLLHSNPNSRASPLSALHTLHRQRPSNDPDAIMANLDRMLMGAWGWPRSKTALTSMSVGSHAPKSSRWAATVRWTKVVPIGLHQHPHNVSHATAIALIVGGHCYYCDNYDDDDQGLPSVPPGAQISPQRWRVWSLALAQQVRLRSGSPNPGGGKGVDGFSWPSQRSRGMVLTDGTWFRDGVMAAHCQVHEPMLWAAHPLERFGWDQGPPVMGSVEDYRCQFLALLCCWESLTPQNQIDLVTAGLGQPCALVHHLKKGMKLSLCTSFCVPS
jgi:hypothetical protein